MSQIDLGPVGAGVGSGVLGGPLVEVLSQVVSQPAAVGMVGFANQHDGYARVVTGKALGRDSGKVRLSATSRGQQGLALLGPAANLLSGTLIFLDAGVDLFGEGTVEICGQTHPICR